MIMKKCCGVHALRIAMGTTMLALLLAGSANAATLTVCLSGCAYSSIQKAIDASNDGDTILVNSGTYYENVNVNKRLKLRGIGNPVVDAGGSGSVITLAADGITLEGFTAIGSGLEEAGIWVTSSNNTLSGNNASKNGNTEDGGSGIYLESSSNNTLIGNNASNNSGNGISMVDSGNNTVIGNNASSNKYYGIELIRSGNNTLIGNNASNNNNGIYLNDYSDNNSLKDNFANSNNYHGIKLYFSGNITMTGNNASNNLNNGFNLDYSGNNTLRNNFANSNIYEGIYLESSSSNIIYNNYFSNNNAFDDGNNIWNINKTSGTNIINGAFSGGNFWSDYAGKDTDGDGLGDTMLPYDSSGEIANGGDYLPLIAPLPFAVNISISGKPIIAHTNGNILVEFTNFSSGDPYNISINAPNGTRVYYENAILNGTHLQTVHINWTPQSTGNYTIEAWGRGMIESAPVYVYDSKVVPVSDLGTIVLIAAIVLGFIGIKRQPAYH